MGQIKIKKPSIKEAKVEDVKLQREDINTINDIQIEMDKGTAKEVKMQKTMFQRDRKTFFRTTYKDRQKLKKKPEYSYLITMKFLNGTQKTFVVVTKGSTFKMGKKTYFLVYEEAFFDLSMRQYHLTYMENAPCPINREVHVEGDEVFASITSQNVQKLIDMEYIKVLAQSQEISKVLKTLLVLAFVTGGIALVTLLMFMQKSGMFAQVTGG